MLLGKGILPDAPSEEILVSGGGDGRIVLWRIDAEQGGAISSICTLEDGREEGESILSLAQDGSFLYSGRFDGEVNVWDLETRQLVRSLKAETGDVLTLSLGGGYLFAGGITGLIQVGGSFDIFWSRLMPLRNTINTTRQCRRSERMTGSSSHPPSPRTMGNQHSSLVEMTTLSSSGTCKTVRSQVQAREEATMVGLQLLGPHISLMLPRSHG